MSLSDLFAPKAEIVRIKLDKAQQKAVDSNANRIVVVAGAGSGKTRILTERVKKLLIDGVAPHNIVCITFTNAAAQEMKERLADVLGIGDTFIGTIHGFANQIYANSGVAYRIFNDEVNIELHREILNPERGYQYLTFDRFIQFNDMQVLASTGKIDEAEVNNFLLPSERDDLNKAEDEVRRICKARNIITFDELLELCKKYYAEIGGSIEHLAVDEYQDVGPLEDKFIKSLNPENLFVVGDDLQSLYAFKGAKVEIFKKMIKNPVYETHLLVNNYRNSVAVSKLATQIADQITDKVKKGVSLRRQEPGKVSIMAKNKLDYVLDAIKEQNALKDWFILARTNKEVFMIAEMLEAKGIPYIGFKRTGISNEELQQKVNAHAVKLLTVHTSKGLESPNVVLYGNFPVIPRSYMKNEDERKVMYVGVTRALDNIVVLN